MTVNIDSLQQWLSTVVNERSAYNVTHDTTFSFI